VPTTTTLDNIVVTFVTFRLDRRRRSIAGASYTGMAAATPGAKEDPTLPNGALAV
jgi:hypothetical protein